MHLYINLNVEISYSVPKSLHVFKIVHYFWSDQNYEKLIFFLYSLFFS